MVKDHDVIYESKHVIRVLLQSIVTWKTSRFISSKYSEYFIDQLSCAKIIRTLPFTTDRSGSSFIFFLMLRTVQVQLQTQLRRIKTQMMVFSCQSIAKINFALHFGI
jgi:hypothetical protein